MRITVTFTILLMLLGCSNNSLEKQYKMGPWNGLFGVQKGITKEQIARYTTLSEIGTEKQNFAGMALPIDYGIKYDSIIYTINSVEGLCGVSVVTKSGADTAMLRSKIENMYGKPTIERPNKYATWDKKNISPTVVIAINYAPHRNLIKVFYDNYDRCMLP